MPDAALIERFLEGDIGAFNTLVWRWEKRLFNFVYRTMGDAETSKDICQTVFIKIFKGLKKLREPDKFSSWIYRIALNLCRDELNRKKNRRLYCLESPVSDETSPNPVKQLEDQSTRSPEENCHHQQIGEILKRALMTLPEEQRVVIIMKQYEDLKFTEIADILEQPLNTIKSRLYYGLRGLRKTLEASDFNKEVLFHEM